MGGIVNDFVPRDEQGKEAGIGGFRDDLLRFAVLQLRDRALAEDVVQDTMVAALEGKNSFAGQSSLKTWVFSILRHKIIDIIRRRGREIRFADLVAEGEELDETIDALFTANEHWTPLARPGTWDNPEESLRQRQFWVVFRACLDHLPENTARLFMMREFLDLDVDEIAFRQDLTANHCYVVLYRARMKLRLCLEREWFTREEKRC